VCEGVCVCVGCVWLWVCVGGVSEGACLGVYVCGCVYVSAWVGG
jgi:hypothetical protein